MFLSVLVSLSDMADEIHVGIHVLGCNLHELHLQEVSVADKPSGGPEEPVLAHLEARAGGTRQVWKGRLCGGRR